MSTKSAKEIKLEKRLKEAEEMIDALRNHKVDAVIGTTEISMLRLKQVEDQLQEQIRISANRLKEIESIYQNVPVGLCTLDLDLKFVRINDHLAKMNGLPAAEHVGRSLDEMVPKLADVVKSDLQQMIQSGESRMNVELDIETPGNPGSQKTWLEHSVPLYNQKEEIIGVNLVIEDITDRKKAEEELRKLNANLEERVAERTFIADNRAEKIRELALQMTHVEEKERQRLARVLHDGLQQMLIGAKMNTNLISNRLTNRNDLKEEIDQLNQILDESIEASRSLSYELSPPLLHDHGLVATLHWLIELPHMQGLNVEIQSNRREPDLSQNLKVFLFHAIRELLANIIKHAGVNKAEVHIFYGDQHVRVEVIDRGEGFDSSNMQSGAPTSLGLRSISERLDLMNGEMVINSEPGEGSHFILKVPSDKNIDSKMYDQGLKSSEKISDGMPTSPSPEDRESNLVDQKPESDAIDLLVVDDHQVMRNGLVKLLNEAPDMNIIGEAGNGLEAVDFVRSHQPEVVIMDISMPEMNGIEATRIIQMEYPDTVVIGLSMHVEGEYSKLMKGAGAVNLLNKGGPAEKLFKAIRSIRD